jgi:hypothetical protein
MVIKRIEKFERDRADNYRSILSRFDEEAQWIDGELPETNDTGPIFIPANCVLKQAALQRTPGVPRESYFKINRPLWNVLDNNARAGLLLHELIYEDALMAQQVTSRLTRYYNAYMSSKESQTELATIIDYAGLLESANLPGIYWFGNDFGRHGRFPLAYHSVQFWGDSDADDMKISGYVGKGGSRNIRGPGPGYFNINFLGDGSEGLYFDETGDLIQINHTNSLEMLYNIPTGTLSTRISPSSENGLNAALNFEHGSILSEASVPSSGLVRLTFQIRHNDDWQFYSAILCNPNPTSEPDGSGWEVDFFPTGVPVKGLLNRYSNLPINYEVQLRLSGWVEFYETGFVRRGVLDQDSATLLATTGSIVTVTRGDNLNFDDQGRLIR